MPRERIQHGELLIGPAKDVVTDPEAEGFDKERLERAARRSGVEYHPGVEALSDDERIYEQQSLDVVWHRDGGWVQLQIEAPPEWFEKALDEQAWKSDPNAGPPMHQAVLTGVLDRRQINHLIKTLRRARDAAYGADE
ncbi:hypothetical protein PBI_DEWDROP_57 [Microbacterium phage Dewdrop]|nr:hypothetical protein PBI_LEAF_57 [Microbacterium phage Leaf]QGZ17426.1 hypothetical protein PBI_DEWDROP_57 [Microbacterium phage Dewdrop]